MIIPQGDFVTWGGPAMKRKTSRMKGRRFSAQKDLGGELGCLLRMLETLGRLLIAGAVLGFIALRLGAV